MGRIGSAARVSVSIQQKYPPGSVLRCPTAAENGVMTKVVVFGGFDLRLRRITSSPSQTLRRRLVRTTNDGRRRECSARRRPSRLHFFTLRDSHGLEHCRPVCSDIRSESRFCLHSTPTLWGFPSEYRHPVWHGKKTRMAWLPDGETISKMSLFVLAQFTNVTDRQTYGRTPHAGNSRAYA